MQIKPVINPTQLPAYSYPLLTIFIEEINPRSPNPPLNFNGSLANYGLISLVQAAIIV